MSILDQINGPQDLKRLSMEELTALSGELRDLIMDCVRENGGHLAANLGVVELTIALHYLFDSPRDKIVWDVGHQTYIHKLLTGRKDVFHTLRCMGGLSGFPKRRESEHDIFETGHSSTSISAALGMARARDLAMDDYHVVAVIGDGAMTGGMALEALNDLGHSEEDMLVILNDNEMSISKNVGAISTHLSNIRTDKRYLLFKRGIENVLLKVPLIGKPLAHFVEHLKNTLKYMMIPGIIFEEMGLTYMGPVDGHDIPKLLGAMHHAKEMKGPVLLHVITHKGKGWAASETNPEQYHAVSPKNPEDAGKGFSKTLGDTLVSLAENDPRIVAVTAAMPLGTGLAPFGWRFPARLFDVGIAEQHAVTMAAGLAANGYRPVVAVYSTFLQRAYDQILHDVCLQRLPVIFCIDRAGLVGRDGETHHGAFDLSYLRHMPNMTVLAPSCPADLAAMIPYAISLNGPVAIRYPKNGVHSSFVKKESFQGGKWSILGEGDRGVIFAVGRMVDRAVESAEILKRRGIGIAVVDACVVKPLDDEMLRKFIDAPLWITLEDNTLSGGFGGAVTEWLASEDVHVPVCALGLPDAFVPHGSVGELDAMLSLDAEGVADRIETAVGRTRRI